MDVKLVKSTLLDAAFCKKLIGDGYGDQYSLDVHNRGIQKFGDLKDFKQLRTVDFSFNEIVSLQGLDVLEDLREAKLYHNRLQNTSGLQNNKKIEHLFMNDNHIKEISEAMRQLRALKLLRLDKNVISSITHLDKARSLTYLDLSQNRLSSLEGLEGCVAFEQLNVNENEVDSLVALKGLKQLRELQMSGNRLSSVKGLEHLKNLIVLRLSRNRLASLKQFPSLENLEELYIDHNEIVDIATVAAKFPQLDTLDASSNRISALDEVKSLKSLPELQRLWLKDNPCAYSEDYLSTIQSNISTLTYLDDQRFDQISGAILPAPSSRPGTGLVRPRSGGLRPGTAASARSRPGTATSRSGESPRPGSSQGSGAPILNAPTSRIGPEVRLLSPEDLIKLKENIGKALQSAKTKVDGILTPRVENRASEPLVSARSSQSSQSTPRSMKMLSMAVEKMVPPISLPSRDTGAQSKGAIALSTTRTVDSGTDPMSPQYRRDTEKMLREKEMSFERPEEDDSLPHASNQDEDLEDTPENWLSMYSPRYQSERVGELRKPPPAVGKALGSHSLRLFRIPPQANKYLADRDPFPISSSLSARK